jgi:hypothetical protein
MGELGGGWTEDVNLRQEMEDGGGKWGRLWSYRVFYFIITFSLLIKFPFQVKIYTMLQASSCAFNWQIGFYLYDIFGIVFQKVKSKTFNGYKTWRIYSVRDRRDILLYAANQEHNDTKYVTRGRVPTDSMNFSCNWMGVCWKIMGLIDWEIKFSTYWYFILKIILKTVANTQSNFTGV